MATPDFNRDEPLLLHPRATLLPTNFGALLKDPNSGNYHALSQSWALALALCGGTHTFAQIVPAMAQLYGQPEDRVERELGELYAEYRRSGVLLTLPRPLPEPVRDHQPFIFRADENPSAVHPVRLSSLALQLTDGCPLACRYCYACVDEDAPATGRPMPTSTALRVLDQARAMGVSSIIVGGGEPLIHPDAETILEHIIRLGFPDIVVSTKATTVNGAFAARLRRTGLRKIQVSLDSWLPDEVDYLLGRTGVYGRVLRGLFSLLRHGFSVHIRATITRFNADHFPHLVRSVAPLGVKSFWAGAVVPVGRGTRDAAPTPEQLAALEAGLEQVRREVPGIELPPVGGTVLNQCGGGRLNVFVLADGRVLPCDLITTLATEREVLGSVEEQSLSDIWHGEKTRAFRKPRVTHPVCLSCRALALCTGGCRVRAFIATGDMNQPDPLCPKVYPDRESGVADAQAHPEPAAPGRPPESGVC
jgi:radical SAM protein with 4Fe4S-binding SPASM domain